MRSQVFLATDYIDEEVNVLSFRSRSFGPRRFGPAPVEEGKEYEVDIAEISRRGEGLARIQGFVIFVPETKVGEHVKVRITRVANRFATAEVVR